MMQKLYDHLMQNYSHCCSKCEASVLNTLHPVIVLSTIQFLVFFVSDDVFGKVTTVHCHKL